MAKFMVLPYSAKSEGAKLLAEGLEGLRIKLENSTYKFKDGDCVVNWGNGYGNRPYKVFLNKDVEVCINKKTFFSRMQGHNIVPPFAFSRDEAARHLQFPVLCRTQLEGADGAGIVIAETADKLVNAPLYTQLFEKVAEYRVHLGRKFNGEIVLIAAQRKRHVKDHKVDPRIWTGDSVYLDPIRADELPKQVWEVTKRSMELMPELTFGGFDTIDTKVNGARVVEVNSAPMMTPWTVQRYVNFIKQYMADYEVANAPKVAPKPVEKKVAKVADALMPEQKEAAEVVGMFAKLSPKQLKVAAEIIQLVSRF